MAGIYFHIPFCLTKCNYCDFFSGCDLKNIDKLIRSEIEEINLRKEYLGNEKVETIYFGGGTPSLLPVNYIKHLIDSCKDNFEIIPEAEITFEANPEDINDEYLKGIVNCGVNRISIGIQSFDDKTLKNLNRRHSVSKALNAVELAKKHNISNISVDIIYGIPDLNIDRFVESVEKLVALNVNHISAYNLTYHEGTRFYKLIKEGSLIEVDDETCFKQFNYLCAQLEKHGYIHYELSNFAKEGFYSKHNSSYWFGKKYLGIGPSAHSYNGNSRRWNIESIDKYIRGIEGNKRWYEEEKLSTKDKYNEYILTRLRTIKGINLKDILIRFGEDYYVFLNEKINKYSGTLYLNSKNDVVTLTRKGLFISDGIMEDFFKV
jgi:oxygen-independent coproporphyrinogen-3 oxidase